LNDFRRRTSLLGHPWKQSWTRSKPSRLSNPFADWNCVDRNGDFPELGEAGSEQWVPVLKNSDAKLG